MADQPDRRGRGRRRGGYRGGNREEGKRRGGNTRGRGFYHNRNQSLPDADRSLHHGPVGAGLIFSDSEDSDTDIFDTSVRSRGRRGSGYRGGNRDVGSRRGGNTRGRGFHQNRNERPQDRDSSPFQRPYMPGISLSSGEESDTDTSAHSVREYTRSSSVKDTTSRYARDTFAGRGNTNAAAKRGQRGNSGFGRQDNQQMRSNSASNPRGAKGGHDMSKKGEKHWKQIFGYSRLLELINKLPSDVVFEFSANIELFKDVLDCTNHSDEMINMILNCLSKACKYTGLRQQVLNILTTLEASEFLKITLLKFIVKLKSLPEISLEEYEASMLYILNICKEIKSRIPSSMFQVVGITTILGQIVSKLSDSERPSSQELILAYKHLDDSNEEEMEQITSDNNKSYRQSNFESNQQPPQDFHEIPVFPEMHDIHVDIFPFLRKNKIFGGYENLQHYLDVQFRLLREDFIGPLRDGIQDYIAALKRPKEKGNSPREIRVYTDVQLISTVCNSSGLCRRVSFSCQGFKRIRWESSKRLLFGSLVCLSTDNFDTLYFATVGNRDLKDLKKGLVDLKFETDARDIVLLSEGAVLVMAESNAFFEAYRHVLTGLKSMHRGDLAFEKYIVSCETDVDPPAYLQRNPRARYDLRPLVDTEVTIYDKSCHNLRGRQPAYTFSAQSQQANNVKVSNVRNWPAPEMLHLDESQFSAVQMALSKEFVIIQGPPGTGKTYIGLKIVKALLHNKDIWCPDENNSSPLLVVCYTNHALDQFLEGILGFYKGNVLRLGSRSSSEVMKLHNINSKRMALRRDRSAPLAFFRERAKARVHMNSLKAAINKISERIEAAKREVLHEETLETAIGQGLWRQLIHGHQLLIQEMRVHGFIQPLGKKKSAILEWLGYGNLTCGQETLHLPSLSTTQGIFTGNDQDDDEDDEDEFIDALDEADGEMKNRLMDIFDDENYEEIDDDGAIAEIKNMLQTIGLTTNTVALDVSSIGKEEAVGTEEWTLDRKQKKAIKKTIRKELASSDKMNCREVTRIQNIWKIEQKERWRLYRNWVHSYCATLQTQVELREHEFQEACDIANEMQLHEDKEIMRRSSVIGLTTTCAARYQSVLKEIGPKIIVVEEAAEVLEAHVITTLRKHCEHLILIGDHQQLKPNPTVYKLARDYKLEISLFERLINNKLDYRCLALQHRMRPEISRVMRIIYPHLLDHEFVKSYEPVKGVSKNAFFIEHTEMELSDADIKSHSNIHEAEYIVALCTYLLLQGYKPAQITVLTLYSAQLFELKRRMPKSNFNGVHLTVVDNYQGEENDIILLSLVRSNARKNLGFLGIENRICVSLSRARKGLYVIGNFQMLKKDKLWGKIVTLARKEKMIGNSLALYCQNHPNDGGIHAITANDFKQAPEGGCMKPCEFQLKCGHVCTRACHIYDKKHKEFMCMKPCEKIVCELRHKCSGICSKKCKKCKITVPKIIPKCGHVQNVPCSQEPITFACLEKCEIILSCKHICQNSCGDSHTVSCQEEITKTWPCGHSSTVKCCKQDGKCPKQCRQILDCEHICKGTCGECLYGRLHKSCKKDCKRPLVCEHLCKDKCSNCPPCARNCQTRCVHSKCQKYCGDVCIPCVEPCEWQCEHHSCKEVCSKPCKRPRCNHSCKKMLKCGHKCIGLCGELCPDVCRICNHDKVIEIFFGTEDDDDARFVQLQDCRHFFEVSGLDRWMDENIDSDLTKTSIKLKECPKCKTPIRRNLRYGNMIKEVLKDIECVKKQMIGDEKRIDGIIESIQEGIVKLTSEDRATVKQQMANMSKRPVSVQNFGTVNNQVNFFARLSGLEKQHIRETDSQPMLRMYSAGFYNDIKCLRDFIAKERKYFTTQEVIDIIDEFDRLKLLVHFLHFKVKASGRALRFDDGKKTADMNTSEGYLTNGKRLSKERKTFVQEFIERMKDLFPRTGLGITDDERMEIVKAMDLSKGHWYKCPNGHVYAIGECGGATVETTCPECKSTIGGSGHRLRGDNALASEMDGATHSAWSEQALMENYDPFEIRF
ncbi:NFX1-type zinc finger-containing protein 1-like [Mytilus trossulus]|uniref:NFX1-type zinc finger-containing protein 1-like n=1 Tax=Mytilus trossulus TaxID=6551 RepID=UPI0030074EDF